MISSGTNSSIRSFVNLVFGEVEAPWLLLTVEGELVRVSPGTADNPAWVAAMERTEQPFYLDVSDSITMWWLNDDTSSVNHSATALLKACAGVERIVRRDVLLTGTRDFFSFQTQPKPLSAGDIAKITVYARYASSQIERELKLKKI